MNRSGQFELGDAQWLAHRYVEEGDRIRFRPASRERHRELPFLTDEYLGDAEEQAELTVAECLAGLAPAKMGFIFHSAFCGSTMLLRALDRNGVAMGLSEPMLLNDVVGLRRRGAATAQVARLADAATRLLGRPFAAGETVIVKPSNILNPLAELLLTLRSDAPAVLLYAPLEPFLISVVRKGLWCRLWVRELLEGQLQDGIVDLGMTPHDIFRQTDLQVAATGWLAQQALFNRLAAKFGPKRVATLDSEQLTGQSDVVLPLVVRHFGLSAGPVDIAAMIGGPAFSQHSKSGAAFDAQTRAAEYRAARAAHGDEIDKVLVWARAVAESARVPMTLPHPLIG